MTTQESFNELVEKLLTKRCAVCPLEKAIDVPDPDRPKTWVKTICGVCGMWLGNRPVDKQQKPSIQPIREEISDGS